MSIPTFVLSSRPRIAVDSIRIDIVIVVRGIDGHCRIIWIQCRLKMLPNVRVHWRNERRFDLLCIFVQLTMMVIIIQTHRTHCGKLLGEKIFFDAFFRVFVCFVF